MQGDFNEYPTFRYLYNLELPKEDLKKLLKFMAYIFEYDQSWQCALCIVGPGSSGKSTFENILKIVLGDRVESVSFKRLESNVHESSKLEDKMVLIVAEPEEEWKGTGIDWFKRITGGDLVDINHKFGKIYSKMLPGKILMICNELPRISFKTQYSEAAFFRRWVIIKFHKQFEVNPEFEKELKNDEDGRSKLFSALLRIVLPVVREEGFNIDWKENRDIWSLYTDPILYFVTHYVTEEQGCEVFKWHVYKRFQEFLAEHGIGYSIEYDWFNRFFKKYMTMLQISFDESYKVNSDFRYGKELSQKPKTWVNIKVDGVPSVEEVKERVMIKDEHAKRDKVPQTVSKHEQRDYEDSERIKERRKALEDPDYTRKLIEKKLK